MVHILVGALASLYFIKRRNKRGELPPGAQTVAILHASENVLPGSLAVPESCVTSS
jgi:hypothetical protein